MAAYSVAEMVKPRANLAHIEAFFTVKGKDLFCILPAYNQKVTISNFKAPAGATATILGIDKPLIIKNAGLDCTIDLSGLKPGDVPAELFVIKIKNAL